MSVPYLKQTELFIDGQWRRACRDERFVDRNPATGEVLAHIASGQVEDIEVAVRAARRSFDQGDWSQATPQQRSRVLFRMSEAIRRDRDTLARLEALDVGKRLEDAKGEIDLCADLFEYYAGAIDKFLGESYRPSVNKWAVVLHEPLGVVAAIVPWNYPMPLGTLKVAPALAMGNTVVLKPAEQAPLTNMALGQLAAEAGLPAGVLNVVPGLGDVAGEALIRHDQVDLVAFTGSTEIGRRILKAAADRIGRVELELGGKSPQIVFPDADLAAAVEGIVLGLFKNAGQDCCAGSRILVHREVYQSVKEKLVSRALEQRVGDPLTPGITMGPVISAHQQSRVHHYVTDAQQRGSRVLSGGHPVEGMPQGSSFYAPTFLEEVAITDPAFQEEIFGPVGVLTPFDAEDEAIGLANATPYGLASSVWTENLGVALRVSQRLKAGMVWVNEYYAHVMGLPFGGHQFSGMGYDYSMHALESYTQLKEVSLNFPGPARQSPVT